MMENESIKMKSYKVYVKDVKTSEKIQEHAFKLGFAWSESEYTICNEDRCFLIFDKNGTISYGISYGAFLNAEHVELTPEEFLSLTQEAVKFFDIKPFANVLARKYGENGVWVCQIFSHKNPEKGFVCAGDVFNEIVEYAPDLEPYIGTNKIIASAITFFPF